jgi:hypothetical protein
MAITIHHTPTTVVPNEVNGTGDKAVPQTKSATAPSQPARVADGVDAGVVTPTPGTAPVDALPAGDATLGGPNALQLSTLKDDAVSRLTAMGIPQARAVAIADGAVAQVKGALGHHKDASAASVEEHFDKNVAAALTSAEVDLIQGSSAVPKAVPSPAMMQIESDWKSATADFNISPAEEQQIRADFAKLSPTEQEKFIHDNMPSNAESPNHGGYYPQTLDGVLGYYNGVAGPKLKQEAAEWAKMGKKIDDTSDSVVNNMK